MSAPKKLKVDVVQLASARQAAVHDAVQRALRGQTRDNADVLAMIASIVQVVAGSGFDAGVESALRLAEVEG